MALVTTVYRFEIFPSYIRQIGFWYELEYYSNETELADIKPVLQFTRKENDYGKDKLAEVGLDVKKPIVSIFVRDSTYLKDRERRHPIDRSYHDIRNADIDNYKPAVYWLIDQGYQVVRIGSIVAQPLDIKEKDFFDYSISSMRSEKLDLLIISFSRFVVGTASGPTDVATVLGIPHLATDYAPFQLVPLGARDMYLPKKIVDIESGKVKPFREYITAVNDIQIMNGHAWKNKYGIEFRDNTPVEILLAVQEMEKNLDGRINYTDNEKRLYEKYLKLYWSRNPVRSPNTPIGIDFLKDNSSLFF